MHECTYAWTNDWLTEWMNEWVTDWLNEWMKEWKNEPVNQWNLPASSSTSAPRLWVFLLLLCEIKVWLQSRAPFADLIFQKYAEILNFLRFLFLRALATVSCTFCRPHLPEVLRTCQFFCWFLSEIELSSLSRTHFANRIFQKCSDADSFFDFYVKSSSRYSLVQMLPTPSSKTAPNVTVLDILKRKSSSRYSPVHVLSTTSADRGPKPRKQRPYFGNHGSHFTRKKHRVSRPRVFSSLNSRVPDLFHFPTTWWWWCGWHDYIYHVASALLVGSPKSFCLDTRYTVVARLRASKSVASAQGIRNLEPKVVSHGTPRGICFCLPLTVIIGL